MCPLRPGTSRKGSRSAPRSPPCPAGRWRNGKLFYLKYKIEGSEEFLIVATTRPETIFGDVAVCINPNDERYSHLKGKKVIVPIVGRVVPIIQDDYVDIEFGTGALKITPAHDKNDYEIGLRHHLEIIDAFTDDAKLNQYGLHYHGKDRFVVRKEIVKELENNGLLLKSEDYLNKVGTSERTGAVVEQRPLDQWFLKMEELVKPALKGVLETDDVKLFPKKFENTYRHWMENIRDWNISRQLWWGHQIPAYYYGTEKDDFVVAETKEKALELAKTKANNPSLTLDDLIQDEDALDTWFSSWLWPISVFNGILEPENPDYQYYYPTNDLVTGPDILFFWVARMIIAGYEFDGRKPFSNVYLTGIVRDKKGRKMSKSLGNSPDALKLIEDFGADGVRVGLLLSSAAGNDLLFDEALCQQGSGFANKIWNAFRLVKGWNVDENIAQPASSQKALEWYDAKFQSVLAETDDDFSKYRISDALMKIYKLVWDDFCSWLLEMVKPEFGKPIDKQTFDGVILAFENNLKLLHPFMPFITEEIWQHISERTPENALVISKYPEVKPFNEKILTDFELTTEIIAGIRTVRKEKNIAFKEKITLFVLNTEKFSNEFDNIIEKLGNVELKYTEEKVEGAISFRVKSNEYFIPLQGNVNIEEEILKLEEELKYLQGFLKSVQAKLSNEKFVNSAPEKVVEMERKKQADALSKIETIEQSLKAMKN